MRWSRTLRWPRGFKPRCCPRRTVTSGEWESHYRYAPAGLVSGDYCDIIRPETGRGLFLQQGMFGERGGGIAADVPLPRDFRSLVSVGMPLTQAMSQANRLFCESTLPSSFATLVAGGRGLRANWSCAMRVIARRWSSPRWRVGVGGVRASAWHVLFRSIPGEPLRAGTGGLPRAVHRRRHGGAGPVRRRVRDGPAARGTGRPARSCLPARRRPLSGGSGGLSGGRPEGDDVSIMVVRRVA